MSPLAFDKQGKPFAWHRRTRKLLVRMFRNPAARGTCCQVLDAEGNPLYIDAETEYGEFRKAVGNVPGLYRLDQCDDDGVDIEEAQPAYVSIDLTRNASLTGEGGDVDPLVIIEHMFAIHADVMKTMAMQQASIMAASAEILRAPLRPAAPAVERESRDDDEEDDNNDDELEPDPEPDPWAAWRPMLEMVEPHLPKLGAFLFAQFSAFLKQTATPPAAAPSPPTGSAPAANNAATPNQSAEAASAAAGSRPASATSASPPANAPSPASTQTASTSSTGVAAAVQPQSVSVDNLPPPAGVAAGAATSAPSHSGASSSPAVTSTEAAAPARTPTPATASSSAPAATAGGPRNAAPEPTPAQWQHLYEIRERLSPKERAIAENAMMRMTSELLVQWLAELSALPVDDAVRAIRSMIANLPAARGTERG